MALPYPNLGDGVIALRRWSPADLDCLRQASRDAFIVERMSLPAKIDAESGLAFIHEHLGMQPEGLGLSLAIEREEQAVGLVGLVIREDPYIAGIGYWIIPQARGQGLAARAVRLLADWSLGPGRLQRVEALVDPENYASQRVARAAGFREEGVLRDCLQLGDHRGDAVVFSRVRRDLLPSARTDQSDMPGGSRE